MDIELGLFVEGVETFNKALAKETCGSSDKYMTIPQFLKQVLGF